MNGFKDDQWNAVFDVLSDNRLNDEQFGIIVDMLDILLHRNWYTSSLEQNLIPEY
jgi:hypothetical protein